MSEDVWKAQIEALGAFIRTQRKLANLSLRELAQLTNLSNAYISQLERGLHEPSVRVLKALSAAFGLPPDALLAQAGLLQGRVDGSREENASTEAAILADPTLSPGEKEALLSVYRSFAAGKKQTPAVTDTATGEL